MKRMKKRREETTARLNLITALVNLIAALVGIVMKLLDK